MPLEDFQILRKIGVGRYSSVYQVRRCQDNKIYAMKRVNIEKGSEKQRTNALTEIKILSSAKHEGIIGFKEVFYDDFMSCLCIILQYADGGDLNTKIEALKRDGEHFSEDETWKIILQINQALQFLHSNNIIHRDLKTTNILLFSDGKIKISDLNVSKIANGLCKTQTGTLSYASPEIWKGQLYSFKTDMWSLGCLLYQIMCLKRPYEANDLEKLYKQITRGAYAQITEKYSKELKELVCFLLQPNQKLRLSSYTVTKMCKKRMKQKHILNISIQKRSQFVEHKKQLKLTNLGLENSPEDNYQNQEDFQLVRANTNPSDLTLISSTSTKLDLIDCIRGMNEKQTKLEDSIIETDKLQRRKTQIRRTLRPIKIENEGFSQEKVQHGKNVIIFKRKETGYKKSIYLPTVIDDKKYQHGLEKYGGKRKLSKLYTQN